MKYKEFEAFCIERHDVYCNQKYGEKPYSYHLKMVRDNVIKFLSPYVHEGDRSNLRYQKTLSVAIGHDLIEDARMTYHDIKKLAGEDVAEGVYYCTDLRGKTRKERHSEQYLRGVRGNNYSRVVKLCDILANITESKVTGSSMLERYKEEWPNVKSWLLVHEEYMVPGEDDIIEEIESLLGVGGNHMV